MNEQPPLNDRAPMIDLPWAADDADPGRIDDLASAALTAAFLAPLKPVTRVALCAAYGLPPAALDHARMLLGTWGDDATLAQRRDLLLAAGWTPQGMAAPPHSPVT